MSLISVLITLGLAALSTLTGLAVVLWWGISGYFITNLSVKLALQRSCTRSPFDKDDLVVTIDLVKGTSHSVALHSINIEIFELDPELFSKPSIEGNRGTLADPLNRSTNAAGRLIATRQVRAYLTPERGRALNLAPSEQTNFVGYAVIDPGVVCEAVVTIQGERYASEYVRPLASFAYRKLHSWGLRREPKPSAVFWTASAVSVPPAIPIQSSQNELN